MRGIHRSPVNSPHKGPVTRKMFPFDDVIKSHRYAYVSPCCVALCFHHQFFVINLVQHAILWIKIMESSSFWNKEHGKLWWIQIKINYLVPFKRSWQTWNILTFLFSLFWLNCHCYPNWRGSRGQHGAYLGSVGPSWARVGPMNFAIRDCYHYRHHHYYHHYYDESLFYVLMF